MNGWQGDESEAPAPEILAAYCDGELSGDVRRGIESWLERHPAAAAEVAHWRRLAHLWRATTPPAPAPAAWKAVWDSVRTVTGRPAPARAPSHWGWYAGALAAACLTLAVGYSLLPRWPGPPAPAARVAALPVASEDEVEIITVPGNGAGAFVVGQLPVAGPLVLAGPGEVTITQVAAVSDEPLVYVQDDPPVVWLQPDTDGPR